MLKPGGVKSNDPLDAMRRPWDAKRVEVRGPSLAFKVVQRYCRMEPESSRCVEQKEDLP